MANLANRETRRDSVADPSFRRDTMQGRRQTALPDLEVNARIRAPNTDNADELTRILGLAAGTAGRIAGDIKERKDADSAASAEIDFQVDDQDEDRYAASKAYRSSWQLAGAKAKGIQLSTDVTEAVNDRLANEDDPATLEDIQDVIDEVYKSHVTDGKGNVLDFGDPKAVATLGVTMRDVRAHLLTGAVKIIKQKTDEKLVDTVAYNVVHETYAGMPVGGADPVGSIMNPLVTTDPLAPLAEPAAPPSILPSLSNHEHLGATSRPRLAWHRH